MFPAPWIGTPSSSSLSLASSSSQFAWLALKAEGGNKSVLSSLPKSLMGGDALQEPKGIMVGAYD